MEIQVYALAIDRELTDEERDRLVGILPYARYQRLTRARENRQNQAMCAYGLLRHALEEQYGLRTLPAIELSREGKPMFRDRPEIHFNLSHTDGAVLCAVHDHPVGVDIERSREAAVAIMRYYQIQSQDTFWRMWVRREAIAKCHGQGFSVLPHWDTGLEQSVDCVSLPMLNGFYAAAATGEKGTPMKAHVVTLDEMLARLDPLPGREE